jgi:glycosyltransferase involved in cell wall biosynthesis
MRVLQVINTLALGGAEVLVCDLVPRLIERGLEVSVAVLQPAGTRLEASVKAVPGCRFYVEGASNRSPLQVLRLAKLFSQFDVVHSHLFPSQLWVAAAGRIARSGVKLVTTEHNPDNNRRGKGIWYWPDSWMYRQYDSIVCNSQATADALHGWVPCSRSRTTVIPNGIDFERFATGRSARQSERPMTAIFVARLEPQKDHLNLLRALPQVPGLHLKLVGDGSLRSELESFAAASGLNDRVEFLGWRDDVSELLNSADIYVHSTHSDGFAIAVAEAMAAGLPVVASNVPGLSWVVGDAAILCKPGDADDMASQLRMLAGSEELRRELGQQGKLRARQFSIDATVSAHINLYESLVGSSQTACVQYTPGP